ncbi:MAG: M42 family metallopeptidase [Gemmatimonadetes bacterium]|uniref:M42 family metallopeptidase n=1 Tax=Candidatus Kutchimonas denitrificans TaxID=3056748 RepID=A0AAE4Z5U9_9BACT|nr:M42 family metallopeptidase [Gemmatimonadota bacterium]NIR74375.1 M42 family metallopeptidase [Candidatus Kutchimonas denitrificans]NIS02626.1 M42 family metallopeptidase [Gemmatimonadota bacterium]NIT68501.1 M42 family metallopeptidase [Gemmatimonadota bacterium]NIU51978.1 M20/M25/M40 family metallo-hydrolase [Gemmatimonadota bacterium]
MALNPTSVEFFKRLLSLAGPSGYESSPARAWREEAKAFADEVWADVNGNSFAAINRDAEPRVMLAGHVDEIGLMINHIDDDGFLYFSPIGGWDPEIVVGQRVEILARDGTIPGVIGKKAIHLQEKGDRDKASKIKDLWIDIGARDGKGARGRVRVGDAAVLRADVIELPNDRIVSRSVDNRMGALIALEALRRLAEDRPTAHVVATATAQEEIGFGVGGGARPGAYGLDPQVAIVIDVTHATDHPGAEKKGHGDHRVGGGPVLSRGSAVNPVLFERLVETAEREKIPFSIEATPSRTSTDADSIFTTRLGIATALVSVPNRYMHSPNEMVSLDDLDRAAQLIATTIRTLRADDSFVPG